MAYDIGLDIGITSIGFAAVNLNENEEPCGILEMVVRMFDKPENPRRAHPSPCPAGRSAASGG